MMRIQFVLVALLASVLSAEAGILIVETSREGGAAVTSTIRIEGDRIRMESTEGGEPQVFIYRADTETMYLIEPGRRSYQAITKQDLEQLGAQMAQMRAMIEEQLRSVPAAQRAMVEQMMRSMPGMADAQATAPVVYRRLATGEQVGQWTCDRYEGLRNEVKVQEVCAADWRSLDLTAEDFQVFQDLAAFFAGLASQLSLDLLPVGVEDVTADSAAFPGVPVSRTTYANGRAVGSHEITEVSRQEFEAALFEVPADFQQAPSPLESLRQ